MVPRIGAHRIHLRRYFHVAHRLVVGAGSPEQCERLVVIAEGDPDGGEGDGVEAFARRASLEIASQCERFLASVRSGKNGRAQELSNP